ncbi:MAG: DUF4189 domain-containing protein [Rhizobiaceae bacterium]
MMIRIATFLIGVFYVTSAMAGGFGAIAFSESDGKIGYVHGANSQYEAESGAISYCQSAGGRSCRSIFWVNNTCGALATPIGSGAGRYGFSHSQANRNAAQLRAIAECTAAHGVACDSVAWVCG